MQAPFPNYKVILFHICKAVCILLLLFVTKGVFAQNQNLSKGNSDTATRDTSQALIHVLNNDYGEFIQGDGRAVQKLMHNVKLRYGSDTMYCDSAFFYTQSNSVEALGNVAIYEADGTTASAEYMRYTGKDRQVYMRSQNSDVELDDGKGNVLWSREVRYALPSKTAYYVRGATLQNGQTIISSERGTYNLQSDEARFIKDVTINDPQYFITSKDLSYNTKTKVVTFFDSSVVTNDASILKTTSGSYNTLDSTSYFTRRSAIWNKDQFLEADTIDYHHETGIAIAKGRIIAKDTAQGMTLFAGSAILNEKTQNLLAFQAPLIRTVHGEDTLYLKADTFFSAPIPDSVILKDSIQNKQLNPDSTADSSQLISLVNSKEVNPNDSLSQDTLSTKDETISLSPDSVAKSMTSENINSADTTISKKKGDSLLSQDTMRLAIAHQPHFDSLSATYNTTPDNKDSSKLRYFTAYHHAQIFSDSLQGRCDSMYYSQMDSLLRMYGQPLLWPNESQVAGEVINLKVDKSKLKELIVPKEGILINRSGPEKAGMFNQIQGGVINGYFKDNHLQRLVAQPSAESIYYVVNDDDEYVGCSKASSREIEILFDTASNKINRIYYRQDVQQKMTPMTDVQPQEMRLSRFKWQEDLRPKSLETFLKGVSQPHEAEWKN